MKKRGWVVSALISFLITVAVFLWSLFFNWGLPYFAHNFSFSGMILPFIIAFVVFMFIARVIVFGVSRTRQLSKGAKEGTRIDVTVVDGLPNMGQGMVVTLGLEQNEMIIKSQVADTTATLPYTQIKNVGHFSETEIREKSKSVAGRAVIGGLLLGNIGAIVGGMTGIGTKAQTVQHDYLIINYTSKEQEEKILSFSINQNITWGLAKFTDNLKSRAGIKTAATPTSAPPKDVTL